MVFIGTNSSDVSRYAFLEKWIFLKSNENILETLTFMDFQNQKESMKHAAQECSGRWKGKQKKITIVKEG